MLTIYSSYILIEFQWQSLEIPLCELWSLVDVVHDYDETTCSKVSLLLKYASWIPLNLVVWNPSINDFHLILSCSSKANFISRFCVWNEGSGCRFPHDDNVEHISTVISGYELFFRIQVWSSPMQWFHVSNCGHIITCSTVSLLACPHLGQLSYSLHPRHIFILPTPQHSLSHFESHFFLDVSAPFEALFKPFQ